MTIQQVHPGGYFWHGSRTDRELRIRQLAARAGRVAVVAATAEQAKEMAERLTLSGLPILLATDVERPEAARAFVADGVSSLVTTHDYLLEHAPIPAPVVVHHRLVPSVRKYLRRIAAAPAPVHVSFIVPEDQSAARTVESILADDDAAVSHDELTIDSILVNASMGETASVTNARRRFLLAR